MLRFEGILAPYGTIAYAQILDVFAPGAFSKSLEKIKTDGHPVGVYWFHKLDEMIGGVTKAWEDNQGLWVEAEISDTSMGLDIQQLIIDKHLRGLSVGFYPARTESKKFGDSIVRYITSADLMDCTIVPLPADPAAKITRIISSQKGDGITKQNEAPAHSSFTTADAWRLFAANGIELLLVGMSPEERAHFKYKLALKKHNEMLEKYGHKRLPTC